MTACQTDHRLGASGSHRRERLIEKVHALAACGWIVAIGISTAAEAITFGLLAAVSVVRWREVARRIADRSIRWPILLLTGLLGWMVIACSWGGSGIPLNDRLPERTFIGIWLVVGAAIPRRWLMASLSAAGLWWSLALLLPKLGLAPPSALQPKHVSQTFLGFDALAAAGLGLTVAGRSHRLRIAGVTLVIIAIGGAGLAASRGHVLAMLVAIPCCFALVAILQGQRAFRALAAILCTVAALVFVPQLPVWTKARAALERSKILTTDAPGPEQIYRAADPVRADLHHWTWIHAIEAPFMGHGSRTWGRDFRASMDSGHGSFNWDAKRRARLARIDTAHSLFLDVAYEFGFIGLATMLAVATSLLCALPRANTDIQRAAMAALLIITGVAGLGDLVLNSRPMAARFAIAFALAAMPVRDPCASDDNLESGNPGRI